MANKNDGRPAGVFNVGKLGDICIRNIASGSTYWCKPGKVPHGFVAVSWADEDKQMTTVKNDGGLAFPKASIFNPDWGDHGRMEHGSDGMTMRQWYATHAMMGMLANPNIAPTVEFPDFDGAINDIGEILAQWAFRYADAMIAEDNK